MRNHDFSLPIEDSYRYFDDPEADFVQNSFFLKTLFTVIPKSFFMKNEHFGDHLTQYWRKYFSDENFHFSVKFSIFAYYALLRFSGKHQIVNKSQ